MIDAQTVDWVLDNDPDVSIIDRPGEFEYTVDVSVGGMTGSGRIMITGRTSKTCVVFTTEPVSANLREALRACEQVAGVTIAIDHGGEFCFRAAVLRADSVPFAIMNTLQFLAIVKIKFDEMVRAKG